MVTVLYQSESHYQTSKKKIQDAIVQALTGVVTRDTEVGVSIVGDRRMKQLNSTYRKIDATTDVLSFPLNDPSYRAGVHFIDPPDDILRLGDIIVSYPQAVLEAAETNMLVDDKIVELVLHGLNHLLGIHHPE